MEGLYFSILTTVVFWGFDGSKAENCNTTPPNYGHCHENLTVDGGRACYYSKDRTSASISCKQNYTLAAKTIVSCINKDEGWKPTAKVICSPVAPSYLTPTLTVSFTSTLVPSEHSLIFSVSNSGSPFLTTYTAVTTTEVNEISSYFETVHFTSHPMTASRKSSIGSSSLMTSTVKTSAEFNSHVQSTLPYIRPTSVQVSVNPSMTADFPSPAETLQKQDDTGMIAAYITIPIVIIVLASLLFFGLFWWRRRKQEPSIKKERELGAVITNEVYAMNGMDRSCSLTNVRQSRVDEYAEISLDRMDSDKNFTDNYQTIGNIPENNAERMKSYDNFKMSGIKINHGNYSHIESIQTPKDDKTYTHIPSDDVELKPEMSSKDDDDNTYNKLNTTTLTTNKVKQSEDTEYNHVHAGSKNSVDESDNYSHLGINKLSSGNPGKCEDYHENNGFNIGEEKSALSLSPKTEYDFARDFDELNASTTKQPNGASHLNETTNQTSTNYEFAKDFDNTSEYAKVTKQKPNFMKSQTENNDYETAVGTKHNYLILEPDTAANSSAFQVVGDEIDEKDEQNNEINSHEYFILEKTET